MQSAHERKFAYRGEGLAGRWDVYQVALSGTPAGGNPFKEVSLSAVFTSPSGRELSVGGFYDGGNIWKARCCPNEPGEWRWRAELRGAGISERAEGHFRCVESENPGPLSPHPCNPHYFADGRGATVYLLGVRNFFPNEPWYLDGLKHERPGDDWSDRDAINYAATRTSTYTTEDFLDDLVAHSMNYLAMDTAHIGRFAAPHNTLWPASGFRPDGNAIYNVRDRYNLTFAKRLDEILRYAGRVGVHVRLMPICGCCFWEHMPLAACNGGPVEDKAAIFDSPEAVAILDAYYTYIVNRYAAYPNVQWEVGNEIWNFNRETYAAYDRRMVEFFHARDPYRHLVTADTFGDLVSFHIGHQDPAQIPALLDVADQRGMGRTFCRRLARTGQMWYPVGDEYGVDEVTYRRTREHYDRYPSFIHVDEFLLRGRHYQRLGMWAAFMAGGSTSSMDHPKYDIHTDPAVMDDHLHLARLIARLDLPALRLRDGLVSDYDPSRLRAYALASHSECVLYLHHFADHARPCIDEQVRVELPAGEHVVRHYDPQSGRWGNPEYVDGGTLSLPLPEFLIDHAVHIARA